MLIDGKVYAVNEAGDTCVFAAGLAYQLLAKNSVHENVMASTAVADNRLFIRGLDHLFCIAKPAVKAGRVSGRNSAVRP